MISSPTTGRCAAMHDATMQLLLQATAALLIIVAAAQVCGRLAPRIGQPAVVGEMAAGVLLGPSALGLIAPQVGDYAFSAEVKPTLFVIAMFGLSFYMFLVGVEHHHEPTSRREALVPGVLAMAGVVAPMVLGSVAALAIQERFRPEGVGLGVFVLFVGGSLSVTAFPMLARILQQRNMMNTPFGGAATRAAAIDDALAWCVLAVVGAMAVNGSVTSAWRTIVPAIVFAIGAFWLLPKLFGAAMRRAVAAGELSDGLLVAILCLVLAAGWFTDYIGIYSVFGGFIAGMALPHVPGFSDLLTSRTLQLIRCLFLPVFFAYSGLNTDLTKSLEPGHLAALAILLVTGFVSKWASAVGILRAFRWPWDEALAMGALMNARGLMILIFINVGLGLGIIETGLFSILVVIAIVTTGLAMPLYRRHFTDEREAIARAATQVDAGFGQDRSDLSPIDVTPDDSSLASANVASSSPGNLDARSS